MDIGNIIGLNIDLPVWLLLLLSVTVLYYIYMTWHYDTFKKMGVLGPKPEFAFGNSGQIMKQGAYQFELENVKKYGKTYGIFIGQTPCLVVHDLDMLKQILIKDFKYFRNNKVTDIFGTNNPFYYMLMLMKDDHWRHVRNTLSPSFSAGKLKLMNEQINCCCDQLVKQFSTTDTEGFELKEVMGAFTMDVIASTGYGLQLDSHKNPDHKFLVHSKNLLMAFYTSKKHMVPLFLPFFRKIWLRNTSIVPREIIDFFSNITLDVIKQKKTNKRKKGIDFTQLMADKLVKDSNGELITENNGAVWNKNGLTEMDIIGNATLLFVAGYGTVSNTLSFVFYNLALHQDCQDKLIREIDDAFHGEEPCYEDLSKLQYLQQVIDETLRLYPAPRVERSVEKDIQINGFQLKKGMLIGIPIYALHMDPEVWPDPERFDPERFTAEKKASRDPLQYMPFGHGPRSCIGMRLGLMETKIAIIKVLQKYRVHPCNKTQVPLKLHPIRVLPIEGGWIKAKPRAP